MEYGSPLRVQVFRRPGHGVLVPFEGPGLLIGWSLWFDIVTVTWVNLVNVCQEECVEC